MSDKEKDELTPEEQAALEQQPEDTDVVEDEDEAFDGDWKKAAKKLKSIVNDHSIDNYFKRLQGQKLREKYNDGNRSKELYDSIMAL